MILARIKCKRREEGAREARKERAEADFWSGHGGDRFPEKWEEILYDKYTFDVNLFLSTKTRHFPFKSKKNSGRPLPVWKGETPS